jgi:hypothetical protein
MGTNTISLPPNWKSNDLTAKLSPQRTQRKIYIKKPFHCNRTGTRRTQPSKNEGKRTHRKIYIKTISLQPNWNKKNAALKKRGQENAKKDLYKNHFTTAELEQEERNPQKARAREHKERFI